MDSSPRINLTKDGKSWIIVLRRWHPLSVQDFNKLWCTKPETRPRGFIMGNEVAFPRYTSSYGKDYTFSGQTTKSNPMSDAPIIETIQSTIDPLLNGALLNFYETNKDNCDYIGAHSDDEKELCSNYPIYSITWCNHESHFRRFRMIPKDKKRQMEDIPDEWKQPNLNGLVIKVYNGDLIIMGGECQKTHKHEILRSRKTCTDECIGKRINLTLRRFREHRTDQ